MKKKLLLLITLLLILTGCTVNESSTTLSSTNKTTKENITYQKDENGFYDLGDDYFKLDEVEEDSSLLVNNVEIVGNSDYPKYDKVKVFAAGERIDCFNCKINFSHTWTPGANERQNNGVCFLNIDGKVRIDVQCSFSPLDQVKVTPEAYNIIPEVDLNTWVVSFEISEPGQYVLELRSHRCIYFFVDEIGKYDEYKNNNTLYFGPGIYTKDNCKYINSDNYIQLYSNQTVFVDYGAVIVGGFYSNRQSNIKIVGGGIVSGAEFDRNATDNSRMIPFDIQYCTNVLIDGITTLDPAGWCYNMYFCNSVTMKNLEIISSRSNGDGISLQSCQNVEVSNSFLRTWDDSLVVKNYPEWSNRNNLGTTRNINMHDCIIWTDLAQSMEIGFETCGEVMDNIVFNNITVLHNLHKAVISIHNGNNANITNVKFTNITIEDCSTGLGDGLPYLIEFSCEYSPTWSDGHTKTALGQINGVEVSNVLVKDGIKNPQIQVRGSVDTRAGYNNSIHTVSNIEFKDISIYGTVIDRNYIGNQINSYTNNISFTKTNSNVTGASIVLTDNIARYGNNYNVIRK